MTSKQRVAVRRRSRDRLGADIAAGARPVLDDELLAQALRQRLRHQARDDVGGVAGRKADDHVHRPGRIGLRFGNAWEGRQNAGNRCQVQQSSAAEQHGVAR